MLLAMRPGVMPLLERDNRDTTQATTIKEKCVDEQEHRARQAAKKQPLPGQGVDPTENNHSTGNEPKEETIGDRIRARREALGWSQRKLAWKAGLYQEEATISNVTLNAIETNKTKLPSLGVLIPIAKALHVEVEDLLRPGGDLAENRSDEALVYQLGAVMPDFTEDQIRAFAQQFRELSDNDKEYVLRTVYLLARDTGDAERPPRRRGPKASTSGVTGTTRARKAPATAATTSTRQRKPKQQTQQPAQEPEGGGGRTGI